MDLPLGYGFLFLKLANIVRPFDLRGETRLIRSTVIKVVYVYRTHGAKICISEVRDIPKRMDRIEGTWKLIAA
jgi:hypothetical protein